jgi:hypothetical protein
VLISLSRLLCQNIFLLYPFTFPSASLLYPFLPPYLLRADLKEKEAEREAKNRPVDKAAEVEAMKVCVYNHLSLPNLSQPTNYPNQYR